jgi:hypothetical protein
MIVSCASQGNVWLLSQTVDTNRPSNWSRSVTVWKHVRWDIYPYLYPRLGKYKQKVGKMIPVIDIYEPSFHQKAARERLSPQNKGMAAFC